MDILVREYIREDGSSPYTDWFNGLDPYMPQLRLQQQQLD